MGAQTLHWRAGDDEFTGTDSLGRSSKIMAADDAPGLKPSDLLPMSLAACLAYTIVSILQKQRQDLRELTATIDADQDADPPWKFRRIAIGFNARGLVDTAKAQKALDIAHDTYCAVSATLRDAVEVELTIGVEP